MDSKNAKAFYRRGRARQVLGQDDDARSDLLNALKNARTYWAFPKSRHTVYCPSVTVIKRKYTTGNSYQYSRLLQIYHKRTVRPDYARLFAHTHYEVHPHSPTDALFSHSQGPARRERGAALFPANRERRGVLPPEHGGAPGFET